MPDPVWTFQYNYSQTPEGNGFTRVLYGNPVVNEVTGGAPANKRVEIDATNGDCVFVTSDVPSLNESVGCTAEMLVNVSGAPNGDLGIEFTFLTLAGLLQIFPDKVMVSIPGDAVGTSVDDEFATASNAADLLWRFTIDNSRNLRVYRAGTLVYGPKAMPVCNKPFQRFLWWVETGAIGVFREMRVYFGGAVAPG